MSERRQGIAATASVESKTAMGAFIAICCFRAFYFGQWLNDGLPWVASGQPLQADGAEVASVKKLAV